MKKTFKEFLAEVKMSPLSLENSAKSIKDSVKNGFEFEMKFPKSLCSDEDVDYLSNYSINDLYFLKDFFYIYRSTFKSIENCYEDWLHSIAERWAESEYISFEDESIEDEEQRKEDAKKIAIDYFKKKNTFDDGEYNADRWVKDNHKNLQNLFKFFSIDPIYGWYDEPSGAFFTYQGDGLECASSFFSSKLGEKVFIDSTDYENWFVVNDNSINKSVDSFPIELISPPMGVDEAFKMLKYVFWSVETGGIETDSSCGMHVGISIPGIKDKIDPLKLALFMGEQYVLDMFNRLGNTYTKELIYQIKKDFLSKKINELSSKKFEEIVEKINDFLLWSGKYNFANFEKLFSNDPYIEFRAIGGSNYHRRYSDVVNVINRYLRVIEIATTPNLYRKEYMKKVIKLLNGLKSEDELMNKVVKK